MSALALPINELMPMVDQAREQTKCVVVCSQSESPDTTTVWHIALKTLILRHRLGRVTRQQEQLIAKLTRFDFSPVPAEKLSDLAASIDKLVAYEKDILSEAHQLGSEIRVWWNTSLVKLADQVEHLDSIAESLHMASDDEASTLLGIAVEHFAMK